MLRAGTDYGVGLLLIASPWLFGFADESRPRPGSQSGPRDPRLEHDH
jgi:SPW repeat